MKKTFQRSKKTSTKVKDYFKDSLYPESDKWVIRTMPGEKEGLFTCQPSESFHNAIKNVKIRECPILYIPQMVIIREHKVIKKWKGVYQDMMDKGFILPEALKNDTLMKAIG